MNLEANDLLLFARVADAGSFTQGAVRAGLPKSTVSRRIAALEGMLGERLFLRSTRKLTLTEFGERLLDHAHRLTDEVDAAAALAEHRQAAPSGRLRVSMPADFAAIVLPAMLAAFTARYPEVGLELDLSPRRVDILGEGFDLAIRMGALSDDATLVARKLCEMHACLYAAPGYLAVRGTPTQPDALAGHACLRILGRDGHPLPWVLQRAGEHWGGLPPATLKANSLGLLVNLALEGAGIAALADRFASPHQRAGRLVRVLPDWHLPPATAWAVLPGRRLMPAKTRAFLEMLQVALHEDAAVPVACRLAGEGALR